MVKDDIRELKDCPEVCTGADYVLHLAALGSVPWSLEDPLLSNESNINGFFNMLVAARDAAVKRYVYAASSSTHGDHPGLPKVEDAIGLRYFNIFGQHQDLDGAYATVVPKWVASLLSDESVYINGDGETSRDLCYMDNTVQANLLAAITENENAVNQVYSVAVGERKMLNQLFEMIRCLLVEGRPELAGVSAV